ncbi:hypothetical protein [Lysinibacillus sp. FSL K6-4013]|uniref:hypothetical protein n=1 Tax=Lysinibacillus sp. FSL K6-4013 TaxID=2921504 RepID=UPI00315B01F1
MDNSIILTLFKIDLGITHTARDDYFSKLIEGTINEIERKGIKLNCENVDDQMLVADYAAWTYRKRQENIPISRNIQLRLKNRIVRERSVVDD